MRPSESPGPRSTARSQSAAEILQINDLLDRKPGQLSGGQRQRVAIGRAIVREPRIFLMDEPLSNLDAELRTQMRVEINKLHRRLGATMIFVTHDQVEAMTLADRIVVLRKGVIEQVGTPLELYNKPANIFVAGFIGSPRMNLLPGRIGTVEGNHAQLDLDHGQTLSTDFSTPPKPGATITVGVRPEHLVPVAPGAGVLKGEVQIAEQLGGETYVYVTLAGGRSVTVEIKGQAPIRPGEPMELAFDGGKFHVFGPDEPSFATPDRPSRLPSPPAGGRSSAVTRPQPPETAACSVASSFSSCFRSRASPPSSFFTIRRCG